jgi:hypothetical protein
MPVIRRPTGTHGASGVYPYLISDRWPLLDLPAGPPGSKSRPTAQEKRAPDANTNEMVGYLLRARRHNGSFPAHSARVPRGGSPFTTTAQVVPALQVYTPNTEGDHARPSAQTHAGPAMPAIR